MTLGAQVATGLRESILAGELKPGEKLVERKLAEMLKVSQAAVREALQVLEYEGLVVKKMNTATYVTELTAGQVSEIIDVRVELETMAIQLARRHLNKAHLRDLTLSLGEIDSAVLANDYYRLFRGDFRFHQKLWELSQNRTLEKLLTQLCTPLFAYLTVFLSATRQDLRDSVKSHQRLIDAITAGGEDPLRPAVEDHLRNPWFVLLKDK